MPGTIVSTTPGTLVSAPPPGMALRVGDFLWPKAVNAFTSNNVTYPPGSCYFNSIPAPYSTVGDPPAQIAYRVLPEYHESLRWGEQEIIHVFDVPWDLKTFFCHLMLGDSYLDAQNRLRRFLPQRHPEFDHLIATQIACEGGIGVPADLNGRLVFYQRESDGSLASTPSKFGYARYRVTFSSTDFDLASDDTVDADSTNGELLRYVSRDKNFSGENLTLTNVQLETDEDDPKPLGQLAARNFPLIQTAITWHQVPKINEDAILACIGHVNSVPFDTVPGGLNADIGQLVYLGAQTKRDRTPTGRYTFEIKHLFAKRREPAWNQTVKADLNIVGVRSKIVPHRKPYQTADLNQLFKFT